MTGGVCGSPAFACSISHRVHAGPAIVDMHQRRVPSDVKAPAQRRVLVAVYLPHIHLASRVGMVEARSTTQKDTGKMKKLRNYKRGSACFYLLSTKFG